MPTLPTVASTALSVRRSAPQGVRSVRRSPSRLSRTAIFQSPKRSFSPSGSRGGAPRATPSPTRSDLGCGERYASHRPQTRTAGSLPFGKTSHLCPKSHTGAHTAPRLSKGKLTRASQKLTLEPHSSSDPACEVRTRFLEGSGDAPHAPASGLDHISPRSPPCRPTA